MTVSWEAVSREIHEFLVSGQIQKAQGMLNSLPLKQLPRAWAVPFAQLCRRSGLEKGSLKILQAYLHPDNPTVVATDEEIIEYANSLQKVGSSSEALRVLKKCENRSHPQLSWVLANLAVSEWNYAASVDHFGTFIKQVGEETYEALVAQLNRCAGLVFLQRQQQGREELRTLVHLCAKRNYTRLEVGARILQAELEFLSENYDKSNQILSALNSPSLELRYQRLIKKWLAFTVYVSSKGASGGDMLAEVRALAKKQNDWESVRDCDFQEARVTRNENLMRYLNAGSPYEAYRARLEKTFLTLKELPPHFDLGKTGGQILNLVDGTIDGKPWGIPVGMSLAKLLLVLFEDFYRPPTVGKIFSTVFENENYFVEGTPLRIHQLMFRLRQWLKKNQIPLKIHEDGGYFIPILEDGLIVRMPVGPSYARRSKESLRLLQIYSVFPHSSFAMSDLVKISDVSRSSWLSVLRYGIENKILSGEGSVQNRTYRFLMMP